MAHRPTVPVNHLTMNALQKPFAERLTEGLEKLKECFSEQQVDALHRVLNLLAGQVEDKKSPAVYTPHPPPLNSSALATEKKPRATRNKSGETCTVELSKGQRHGQPCGKSCVPGENFCRAHAGKQKSAAVSVSQPAPPPVPPGAVNLGGILGDPARRNTVVAQEITGAPKFRHTEGTDFVIDHDPQTPYIVFGKLVRDANANYQVQDGKPLMRKLTAEERQLAQTLEFAVHDERADELPVDMPVANPMAPPPPINPIVPRLTNLPKSHGMVVPPPPPLPVAPPATLATLPPQQHLPVAQPRAVIPPPGVQPRIPPLARVPPPPVSV